MKSKNRRILKNVGFLACLFTKQAVSRAISMLPKPVLRKWVTFLLQRAGNPGAFGPIMENLQAKMARKQDLHQLLDLFPGAPFTFNAIWGRRDGLYIDRALKRGLVPGKRIVGAVILYLIWGK